MSIGREFTHTLTCWQLHRPTRSQSWAGRSAHLCRIVSVWADSQPPPCTHSYVHHVSCQKKVCLGTQVTGATPAVTEPVYHLGLRGAILKSGPGTRRNLQRLCAPSSVLWDSPDLLSDLESQSRCLGSLLKCYFTLAVRTSHIPLRQLQPKPLPGWTWVPTGKDFFLPQT